MPFITAASDADLSVALGVVHVHLRWAQMELMRHVVHGRLAALMGPPGVGLDRMLRTLDLPRAVPAIREALPDRTRQWLDGFVRGMNHAVERLPRTPPEFRLLGLGRQAWTIDDVLALTRLAAFDVTWAIWLALLPRRGTEAARQLWRRLVAAGAALDIAGGGANGAPARGREWLQGSARIGSNSWCMAPRGEASGAWMANDTHLSPMLPNLWLLAGVRSPGLHAAGLMVPGIPAFLIGRNTHIAWGGTNLHAASSDLFDISGLPDAAITKRRERIKVRGFGHRTLTLRDSPHGPVVSDLPRLRAGGGRFALRWMGHEASDEITGLLAMNRATDWPSFRSALDHIGVPGQNILYADRTGRIAQAMAARLPRRPPDAEGLLLPPASARFWDTHVRARDLPALVDPADGFLASANNRPAAATDVLIGYFFSPDTRIRRIRSLLRELPQPGLPAFRDMQRDVMVEDVLPARDRLLELLASHDMPPARRLARILATWDGTYRADAEAPLAFEMLLYQAALALLGRRTLRLYSSVWNTRGLLARDLAGPHAALPARAVRRAWRDVRRAGSWGRLHRLEPRHVMAAIPVIGRCFRFVEWGTSGGSDSIMKTAHGLTPKRHHAVLASTARHVSDLSDVDANWFVLLGGQDGWLGSSTLVDQTILWREGRYIQVPLRAESVRTAFPHLTELRP